MQPILKQTQRMFKSRKHQLSNKYIIIYQQHQQKCRFVLLDIVRHFSEWRFVIFVIQDNFDCLTLHERYCSRLLEQLRFGGHFDDICRHIVEMSIDRNLFKKYLLQEIVV